MADETTPMDADVAEEQVSGGQEQGSGTPVRKNTSATSLPASGAGGSSQEETPTAEEQPEENMNDDTTQPEGNYRNEICKA